jgi:hypothetical protein
MIIHLGPIICKTIEEKEQILKQIEDDSKESSRLRSYREVLTVDELIEINRHCEYYPELLPSYYVKSGGNDRFDGLSEEKAFKTLARAVDAAKTGIKRITVIGKLTDKSEQTRNAKSVFIIYNTGSELVTITGRTDHSGHSVSEAELSAEHAYKRVLKISGNSNLRVMNITISDGHIKESAGGGILLDEGNLILGNEAKVVNNYAKEGGGIAVGSKGFLKMVSHDKNMYPSVSHNCAEWNGGGVFVYHKGKFELVNGVISSNKSESGGGGVCLGNAVEYGGAFYMGGGTITANKTKYSGGGIEVNQKGCFEMSGGKIIGNTADSGGGLSIDVGSCKLINGIIAGNRAIFGGGIYISYQYRYYNDRPPSLEMSGGTISGNTAVYSGGGVEILCSENTKSVIFTFSAGVISGNIAEEGRGGGIYMEGGSCLMTGNAVLCGNMSREYGGGVYIGIGFTTSILDGNFTIDGNALITGNLTGVDFIQHSEEKRTTSLIDVEDQEDSKDDQKPEKNSTKADAWGGGVCVADALFEMRGGTIKANQANKGGGVFVGSPDEIKKKDRSCAHPGTFGRFIRNGGEITGNSADDIYSVCPQSRLLCGQTLHFLSL